MAVRLTDLEHCPPTMAEVNAQRRAVQKWAVPTRLTDKQAEKRQYEKDWTACKKAVDKRIKGKCQHCHRKVLVTITLCAERLEHAHIIRRKKEPKILTDARNVLGLCHDCHRRFDLHQLLIVQKAALMFTRDGKSYINADEAIDWKVSKS